MLNDRISKLLIANRGEIAVRIIGTAKRLGIQTVAVYSDPDASAMHVRAADEAVHIGAAAASESYLLGDRLLDAAARVGADAIHPGYGFLSENPKFAQACNDAGIIFVGPSPEAMEKMALKDAAKALMEEASVPVVPGYHKADQDIKTLKAAALEIGYPVLIKAVAGGGGKGMRKVPAAADFEAALDSARREARNSFGDDRVLVEKLITKPRHIEVQIFGDTHGSAVHLFERDCSLQRRHQKVVEEAPAPGISDAMRAELGAAAVRAAKAISYHGAGTIEFIADVQDGPENAPFYFMEMNTRLQVEHPVSELVTGQDFVEWQLRIAAGEPVPLAQGDIKLSGHAFEVRLYAEDADNGFMPATGPVAHFSVKDGPGRRLDTGIETGDEVSIHYDPMIAKLITYGDDRDIARARMSAMLKDTSLLGLTSNRDFLSRCINHQIFIDGVFDTGFIDNNIDDLTSASTDPSEYAIAAALIVAERRAASKTPMQRADDPWDTDDCFRVNIDRLEKIVFKDPDGALVNCTLDHATAPMSISVGDDEWLIDAEFVGPEASIAIDGKRSMVSVIIGEDMVEIATGEKTSRINRYHLRSIIASEGDGPGALTSPMPGKILEVLCENDQSVTKGQPLIVMEAMKMEQTLLAARDGIVSGLALSAGDQVTDGALLLTLESND